MHGDGGGWDVSVRFIHILVTFDVQHTLGGKCDVEDNVAVTPDMFLYTGTPSLLQSKLTSGAATDALI